MKAKVIGGKVRFHNIEVSADDLHEVLDAVAEIIKSPGWYFHLVNEQNLYFVMPNIILAATNDDAELKKIADYAENHGIHRDQLNLARLFDNPFA